MPLPSFCLTSHPSLGLFDCVWFHHFSPFTDRAFNRRQFDFISHVKLITLRSPLSSKQNRAKQNIIGSNEIYYQFRSDLNLQCICIVFVLFFFLIFVFCIFMQHISCNWCSLKVMLTTTTKIWGIEMFQLCSFFLFAIIGKLPACQSRMISKPNRLHWKCLSHFACLPNWCAQLMFWH